VAKPSALRSPPPPEPPAVVNTDIRWKRGVVHSARSLVKTAVLIITKLTIYLYKIHDARRLGADGDLALSLDATQVLICMVRGHR
jgi:hypothetical protein